MNALISPLEPREEGYRVAEVAQNTFDVASPFFWVECSDSIVADMYWYNPENSQFVLVPEPEPEIQEQPISQGAQTL